MSVSVHTKKPVPGRLVVRDNVVTPGIQDALFSYSPLVTFHEDDVMPFFLVSQNILWSRPCLSELLRQLLELS
jgi:hypothetical protein